MKNKSAIKILAD